IWSFFSGVTLPRNRLASQVNNHEVHTSSVDKHIQNSLITERNFLNNVIMSPVKNHFYKFVVQPMRNHFQNLKSTFKRRIVRPKPFKNLASLRRFRNRKSTQPSHQI